MRKKTITLRVPLYWELLKVEFKTLHGGKVTVPAKKTFRGALVTIHHGPMKSPKSRN